MVSEQNSKFAPAGYGLGGYAKRLKSSDDLNSITAFGVYGWNTTNCPANAPQAAHSYMIVLPWYDVGSLTQEVHIIGVGVIRRVCTVSTWGEWEWVNPPMLLDTEYRTTERYLGKPVYVKAINFGYLPNATNLTIFHGIQGKSTNIRYTITSADTGRILTGSSMITDVIVNNTEVFIETDRDLSSISAIFTLWYTKG